MAESMAWNLAWVSASSASGSLSATIPPPATRRAVCRSSDSSAQRIATAHVPFPWASTQPTAPPYGPRSNPSTDAIRSSAREPGMAADGGRRRQRPDELEHVRRRARQAALDARSEVLHVRHLHDRRFRFPVEIAAPWQQGVVHHLDHRAVLDLVLGAGDELRRQPLVVVGIAGDRGGPGERVRADHVALDGHEQLGGRPDEPVDREAVARTEAGAEPSEHGVDVDRAVRRDRDRSGDHGLDDLAGPHHVASRLDGAEVVGDVDGGTDVVRRRDGTRRRPADRLLRVVDHRDPGRAVLALAHDGARDDELDGRVRQEGERADRDRPAGTPPPASSCSIDASTSGASS